MWSLYAEFYVTSKFEFPSMRAMQLFSKFFKRSPTKYYSPSTTNGNDKWRGNVNDNRFVQSDANAPKNI